MVIRASISLHADTTYVVPVAAIDYVDLAVSAELDASGKFRVFIETAVVVDGVSFETTKPLADTTSAGDAVSVAALKNLADGFAMNDGSEAVDGSVYSFAKGISNVAFANDATTTAALKLLQDTQVMQDLVAKDLSRPIADVFDMADDETVSALKGLSDSVSMQDSVLTLFLAIRNFADEVNAVDLRATLFSPATKTEQVAVADNDFIDWTKSLAHSVTPADVSVFLAEKPFSESLVAAEAKALLFATARVESVTVPDVGLLSVQDYCDLSYFAEDYVGFSQSF
jgi:hypothetical protein